MVSVANEIALEGARWQAVGMAGRKANLAEQDDNGWQNVKS